MKFTALLPFFLLGCMPSVFAKETATPDKVEVINLMQTSVMCMAYYDFNIELVISNKELVDAEAYADFEHFIRKTLASAMVTRGHDKLYNKENVLIDVESSYKAMYAAFESKVLPWKDFKAIDQTCVDAINAWRKQGYFNNVLLDHYVEKAKEDPKIAEVKIIKSI